MLNVHSITTGVALTKIQKILNSFFLSFCFVFLYINHTSAQADSLLRVYQSASTGQEKSKALFALCKFYTAAYDSAKATAYAHELADLAASRKDTLILISANNFLGNVKHQYNDFEASLRYHQRALSLAKSSRNDEEIARMLYNIGNDYLSLHNPARALEVYIEGTEITKKCDCPAAKINLNMQLASFYSDNIQDYQMALMWGKQALQYAKQMSPENQIQASKSVATFYLNLNQLDSARYLSDIAYQNAVHIGDKEQTADILSIKSEIESSNGQSELAFQYAQQAESIARTLPDKGLKGKVFMALGRAFLLRGDVQNAKKNLLSAEKYILEEGFTLFLLPKLYNLLAKAEEVTAPQQAIAYLRKAAFIQDSLNNYVHKNQVAIFSAQNDNALKEAENRTLRIEAEAKEKRFRILIIPLVIVSILLLGLLYLYQQIRAKNAELLRLNTLSNQQNNALSSSNQRMEWFTNTLSHDALGYINNVLNYAIFGKNIDISKETTTILEKIHKNAVSLKKMSLNLILFKKTGEIANTTNLALTDVVAEVIEDMGEELTHNPLTLHAQNLPMAYADKEFTKQIFRNLLSNAVKFRQPNTELHITISGEAKDNFVEIQVRDNGIGIDADKLSLVFEQFTKLNKSAEGSGLGLFICQQAMEVMGGKIWAETIAEGGIAICFTLPMAN